MADDAAAEAKAMNVIIKDGNGVATTFKIKSSVKLSKIFTAWGAKVGIDPKAVMFTHDGKKLTDPDLSVKQAEIDDGDTIDALIIQTGGASFSY